MLSVKNGFTTFKLLKIALLGQTFGNILNFHYIKSAFSGNILPAKGFVFLVWYYKDRGDKENESGFLCKKRFFVEKTVSVQSDLGAVYLDTNSLLIADVKWPIFTLIDAWFQSSLSI